MAKQTSRMYGIKVKEKINYYEFGDAGTGKEITISYENKVWTIKAGGKENPTGDVSWFMNGVEYHKGDVIDTFNDGDQVAYTIMEQDRNETPYINLMYDVFGNSKFNSKCGNKDVVYKVTSGDVNVYPTYTCKVYKMENGINVAEKSFTNKDINRHKQMYSEGTSKIPLYTVFNNIAFDWDDETLMFRAISNSNYIKYNNNNYSKNETITSFRTIIFEGFEIIDETNKHEAAKVDPNDPPVVKLVKRHGGLTMMTAEKDHDSIFSDVYYDHKDAYYNSHYHDAMYLVYDNPGVEGCWKKKINSLAITYADPYWFLMTIQAGVEYGGQTYERQKLIRCWKPDTSVNMSLKETISRRKTIPDNENYDKFIYNVIEESGNDAVFVYYYQIVATEDEEGIHDEYVLVDSVGFTSSDTQSHNPITWKNLKFKLLNGTWSIITGNQYITYEGKELKSNKTITTFPLSGAINVEIGDNSDKKGAAADKFVYDVEEIGGVDSITVKFQQVVNQRDAQGHNHKSYIDIETRTFSSSESPVTFRNIQFKANAGKWTIYSKCGYIKFSGRTYPTNRSILSFAIAEAIHIEIADESNIYEVKELRLYNVKTPNSEVTVGYSVITSEMTRALKLIKMTGDKEEPWVTVNFYEAMYEPYVYDDISVRYDAKSTSWELYSNNDNLYYNGTNYKSGTQIGSSWSYYTIIKATGMTVVHSNSEALQVSVQIIKDGKVVKNVDVNEDIGWYDPEDLDFHLGYSYAKGLWVFRAIHNCWMDGINYTTGQVIKSFKTKLNIDPFTMMFRHFDDEEHPDIPTNVLYQVTVGVDPFSGVTTVEIQSPGHGSDSFSDKDTSKEADKVLTFTKTDAKSMYGYIWKKSTSPGPTPTDIYNILIPIHYSIGSYHRNDIVGITRNLDAVETAFNSSVTSWNTAIQYVGNYGTRIYFTGQFRWNGPFSLLFADSFGSTWDAVDGFDTGANIIGMINMTTAICAGGYNGRYYTKLQTYTVVSSASKGFDNDISSIISNAITIDVVKAYSLNNVLLSIYDFEYIYNYNFESNSIVHDIKAEIQSDISAAEAQWNFTHFSPDGFIEQQQIIGYSVPNSTYCFELDGKVYMFIKHIYIHYHSGYIWGGDQQDYDVADWECCCYIVDQNGAGELHKNVMLPEDFENFIQRTDHQNTYMRRGPFEYNGNYYFHYVDNENTTIRIAMFDPVNITFTLVKTLTNSDSVLVRNLATGHYMNVYFDTRAYSVSDNWVGAMGFESNSFATKGSHVVSHKADPNNSSRRYYIFFANPLLETNSGNFIIHDDTRISN